MDKRPESPRRPSTRLFFLLMTLVLSVASQAVPAAEVAQTAQAAPAHNPLIWADVPDIAVIRVGKTYYMSSTTMHMLSLIHI